MKQTERDSRDRGLNVPRWVKTFGIVALALMVLMIIGHLLGMHSLAGHTLSPS